MAQAPAPGVGAQREATKAAQLIVTITVRGESVSVAPFNLPLQEALVFRKATGGLSIESFWNGETAMGLDSVKTMWWLGRRAAGEWQLTLEKAWDEWPADLDLESELDVTIDEPDGTHPEV